MPRDDNRFRVAVPFFRVNGPERRLFSLPDRGACSFRAEAAVWSRAHRAGDL